MKKFTGMILLNQAKKLLKPIKESVAIGSAVVILVVIVVLILKVLFEMGVWL